ncbi:MAG: universal stress protein, partial [Sphingomonadales bacterium]|nr:universal stress protein [Sphingomonadales bacterium]
MSLRTILLPVTCHDGQNAASRVALNMAKRFKSHITALHVKADPRSAVPFIGEGMTAEVVKELVHATEKESAAKAKDSLGAFTEAATELGVKECDSLHKGAGWSWDESVGHFGERLGRLARVHDVAIVPQPAGGGEHGEGEFL